MMERSLKTTKLGQFSPAFDRLPIDLAAKCNAAFTDGQKMRSATAWEFTPQRIDTQQLFLKSGVPEAYRNVSFADYSPVMRTQDHLRYALHFAAEGSLQTASGHKKSILIFGNFGRGKTHLATATLHAIITRTERNGCWTTLSDFFRSVQATYGRDENTTQQVFEKFANAHTLLLDEVGKLTTERVSDDRQQLLFDLLDERKNRQLATIITTNCAVTDLSNRFGEGTTERIREICARIEVVGENWRGDE